MITIFKWFFGIIGTILLVYILVVILQTFLSAGTGVVESVTSTTTQAGNSTTSATTTVKKGLFGFSFLEWVKSFHNSPYAPMYVTYDATSSGPMFYGGYYSASENLVNNNNLTWQNLSDRENSGFDSMWGNLNANNQPKAGVMSGDNRYIVPDLLNNSSLNSNQIVSGLADQRVFVNRFFPVFILDQRGNILSVSKAYINGERNTDGQVPFRAVLSFEIPQVNSGFIVLRNENPQAAGLNAVTVIPVKFNQPIKQKFPSLLFPSPIQNEKRGNCVIGGCSMQFCLEQVEVKNLVTTCEWRPAYACYKSAICERNIETGRCGWRMDQELARCLQYSN